METWEKKHGIISLPDELLHPGSQKSVAKTAAHVATVATGIATVEPRHVMLETAQNGHAAIAELKAWVKVLGHQKV